MGFHHRYRPSGPIKRRARFVKGSPPDWIEDDGVLMRASASLVRVNGESQIPGYQTVRPMARWESNQPGIHLKELLAKLGDFGLYLGKKHVRRKVGGGRELTVPVPTFWFNGYRIVFTTLESYDDAVVSDEVYDDWLTQHPE